MKKKKIFVLDTNIILYDHDSIKKFEENDIIIPITVLEELDKFKVGNDTINYNAREFTRYLDKLTEDKNLLNESVKIGEDKGKLSIAKSKLSETIKHSFPENNPDHRILSVAEDVFKKYSKNYDVVFVSKDINLRVKARSIGLKAQDYKNDKVENIDFLNKNYILELNKNIIDKLYKEEEVETKIKADQNQYFILKYDKKSALATFNENKFKRVEKIKCFGITPRNAEQTFSIDSILNDNIKLVALTGKAGTGKTLIALAGALRQNKQYNQIMMTRPIVALSNKDLGYLPGDVDSKIEPYMLPLFDNLGVIKNSLNKNSKENNIIEEMERNERIIISPLAYIRGRSLSNTFMIIDESQNLSRLEVKTIITRAAEGTKLIFTGDVDQIDSPYLDKYSNGLSYLIQKMKGQDIFSHVHLVKGERSYLSELASQLL